MIRPVALLLVLSPLAGCAVAHGPYPSLAPRPAEKGSFDEPVRPVAVVTPDAALDAQIVRDGRELDRIAAGFAGAASAAETRVAAGEHAAVGSDAWLAGQAALATLDDWRSQASALDALAARAAAEADRESATVERLQRRLPAPA